MATDIPSLSVTETCVVPAVGGLAPCGVQRMGAAPAASKAQGSCAACPAKYFQGVTAPPPARAGTRGGASPRRMHCALQRLEEHTPEPPSTMQIHDSAFR